MSDIVPFEFQAASAVDDSNETPRVGRWYWFSDSRDSDVDAGTADNVERLGCCTHVGSNYVLLTFPDSCKVRVHQDKFWDHCKFEAQHERFIDQRVQQLQSHQHQLMQEVKNCTARLAIPITPELPGSSSAVDALTLYAGESVDSYKDALIRAQKETLPELFAAIKEAHRELSQWLNASLIPLQAEIDKAKPAISLIKERIDSVSIYAGLRENTVQIRQGEPAAATEQIRIFQRMAYMDEECLARYEVGGMEFADLAGFDRWLCEPENMQRLLPFQRTILAMQVRRHKKSRKIETLADLFECEKLEQLDESTFLYIRNGQQVWRVRTEFEFDARVFPDPTDDVLSGDIYYDYYRQRLVTAREYADIAARDSDSWSRSSIDAVNRSSVYYDDAIAEIQRSLLKHNKLVLILQGLLDRSLCLHPHPAWQLWTPDGFQQALHLIYDDTRTLAAGDRPDFLRYLADLAKSLKPGSITIGQQKYWYHERQKATAKKRAAHASRYGDHEDYEDRVPVWSIGLGPKRDDYSDPGPGVVARVVSVRNGNCTYQWLRKRENGSATVFDRLAVPTDVVLNLDAYQVGDIRKFFDDPRSRSDYLQWAPLLVTAEKYKAGLLPVREPAAKPAPVRRAPDMEARAARERRARKAALCGKAVRLIHPVTTRGGTTYQAGSLWRVGSEIYYGKFSISGCNEDGTADRGRFVRGMDDPDTVRVDPSIPDEPEDTDSEKT